MTFAYFEKLMFFIEEYALMRYNEGHFTDLQKESDYWSDMSSMVHKRIIDMLLYYVPKEQIPSEDEDI